MLTSGTRQKNTPHSGVFLRFAVNNICGGDSMKYICTVCGYVYDEDKEGVKWEDVPDNYTCPLCSVGKDKFERAE